MGQHPVNKFIIKLTDLFNFYWFEMNSFDEQLHLIDNRIISVFKNPN